MIHSTPVTKQGPHTNGPRWAIRALPKSALALLLVVEALAVGLTTWLASSAHVTESVIGRFVLIVALSVIYAELADRVDRFRRFLGSDRAWVNATSVWSFTAVLILPTGLAAVLVATLYAHTLIRSLRHESTRPHRLVYTAATMILATLTASAVYAGFAHHWNAVSDGAADAVGVAAAIIAFHVVNQGLVAAIMYLATKPTRLADLLISRDDLALELATIVIGVMAAETVLQEPWLSPLTLVLVAVLYRGALVGQLRVDANTDAKTGLLTSKAWHDLAQTELGRAARDYQPVAVLMIDLDHFKVINDTRGHLVGDRVLAAVARCIRQELRGYDAVGRFGGEEFAVLLTNVDLHTAHDVAERLLAGVREIVLDNEVTVTASLGLVHCLANDVDLSTLLHRADTAMFRAKSDGRDQVKAYGPVQHRPVVARRPRNAAAGRPISS